ncbi:MAG TPA: phenylalanine--tRNA ligase subunit alpha [Actinomycetota bacterium]|nr:phenylalanine--tRNA ligase subunit alpha [Actinomycetota bacterium]
MTDLRSQLEAVRDEGIARIAEANDLASLEEAKVRVLGRRSSLSTARSGLRDVPDDQRKELGRLANEVQGELENAIRAKEEEFAAAERELRWERERIDVTLPGSAPTGAAIHPLTKTIWEIVDIFLGLGWRVAEGPEVELSRYNFDALNTPQHHPTRSPQDTYFIAGSNEEVCLRTQTSPMQIRIMELQQPPVYVVVPGRTYRRDEPDPTHLSAFAQIEGLAVDEGITMGDLKGTLLAFSRAVFGANLDIRLRPHYFPFTEPSAEMDVQCFQCMGAGCRICKRSGWIEVLGCGMVDPWLFDWVGYDPDRYTGFAFGMGVERIAALAHGVADIRSFWENDLRFLTQFRGPA